MWPANCLFSAFGSKQILSLPVLGFSTTTRELTQSLDSVTFAIMWSLSIVSNSALSFDFRASGTLCGGCTTGTASSLRYSFTSPGRTPVPLNRTPYSFSISCLSMQGEAQLKELSTEYVSYTRPKPTDDCRLINGGALLSTT